MKRYISEGMTEYLKENPVPWHMPGHKRKKLDIESKSPIDQALHMALAVDVTEVPGTDDLYNPKDMIKDSLDSLAKVYKTYAPPADDPNGTPVETDVTFATKDDEK